LVECVTTLTALRTNTVSEFGLICLSERVNRAKRLSHVLMGRNVEIISSGAVRSFVDSDGEQFSIYQQRKARVVVIVNGNDIFEPMLSASELKLVYAKERRSSLLKNIGLQ